MAKHIITILIALFLGSPALAASAQTPIAVFIGDPATDGIDPAIYGTLVADLEAKGYVIEFTPIPWNGDLNYWRQVAQTTPNWMSVYTQDFASSVTGKQVLASTAPVVLVGTSRAAWCAFWLSATFPKFHTVVAFSPLIDVSIIAEFAGFTNPLGNALNPYGIASLLGQRSIFIEAGIDDQRVGTVPDAGISSFIGRSNPNADLTVNLRPPALHQAPPGAFTDAVGWLAQRVR